LLAHSKLQTFCDNSKLVFESATVAAHHDDARHELADHIDLLRETLNSNLPRATKQELAMFPIITPTSPAPAGVAQRRDEIFV